MLTGLAVGTMAYAQSKTMPVVERVELDKYLGVWYEVARKPMYFQRKCARDVTATYTLNENGNITVDNRCYTQEGKMMRSLGEAYVINPPFNSKLEVSFSARGNSLVTLRPRRLLILKLDDNYQTVLVGEPSRKYLWVLSRTPQVKQDVVNEYLNYASSLVISLMILFILNIRLNNRFVLIF